MPEPSYSENLPYVVKAHWLLQLFISSVSIACALWILWGLPSSNEDPIINIFLFILSVFVLPYGVSMVLFTKTILQTESITHINALFKKRQIEYKDIDTCKIVGNGDIKLNLTDGTSIQILCGTDKQTRVMRIIKSKVLCR